MAAQAPCILSVVTEQSKHLEFSWKFAEAGMNIRGVK